MTLDLLPYDPQAWPAEVLYVGEGVVVVDLLPEVLPEAQCAAQKRHHVCQLFHQSLDVRLLRPQH